MFEDSVLVGCYAVSLREKFWVSCFITVPLPYTLLGLLNPEDESTRIFHNVTNGLGNDTVPENLSLQQHSCDKLRPQEIC